MTAEVIYNYIHATEISKISNSLALAAKFK